MKSTARRGCALLAPSGNRVELFYQTQITAVLIAFARIGTALMFMPGFGEMRIPGRHRLALGMILSLGLMPAIPVTPPDQGITLALLLAREALIGLYIGVGARIVFSALQALGAVISNVSSLSNALAAGDTGYEGSTAVTSLLTMAGVALIFVTDTHHIMLRGLFASYEVIPAGWLPLGDLAGQIARLATRSLYIAALIGAPFFVLAILLNLGLGLANRVMQGMPVFFVAGPAMIFLGLGLLLLAAPAMLMQFSAIFADFFTTLGR